MPKSPTLKLKGMTAMTTPQAVLFDLDGTLLDTARDLGNALNHVLGNLGLPPLDYHQYRDTASHGSIGLLKLGLGEKFSELTEQKVNELRQAFLDFYENNINSDTQLFEQVDELIQGLDNANIPWGIVTNKPGYLTEQLTIQFPQLKACQVIVAGDTLPQRKPHPAPLFLAAKTMGIDAAKAWYVGDALRDIEAGNAANMKTFVANWGYTADEIAVDHWQADCQINSPLDLLNCLDLKR